jgi:hypothetical protein
MKNIFLLPTNIPSRLAYYQESTSYKQPVLQVVSMTSSDYTYQNMYIINDEIIKEGDYIAYPNLNCWIPVQYLEGDLSGIEKKIVLTTDIDLIKEGVQEIEEDFLRWFVKNPSCEEVEVLHELNINGKNGLDRARFIYKIIIPKEELKQEELDIEYIEQLAERITTGEGVGQFMNKPPRIANFLLGYKAAKLEKLTLKELCSQNSNLRNEVIELLHERMRYTLGSNYLEKTTLDWISENF